MFKSEKLFFGDPVLFRRYQKYAFGEGLYTGFTTLQNAAKSAMGQN